jgi:hypothetical protein
MLFSTMLLYTIYEAERKKYPDTLIGWLNENFRTPKSWNAIMRMAVINDLVIEHEGGNEFHG